MSRYSRKSAPEVVAGKVRKKNNWELSDSYYHRSQPWPVIDRKRPGEGYRHLLTRHDVFRFIHILPDWPELSVGLNAIVLAPGEDGLNGYHTPGVVHICAWDKDFWVDYSQAHYEEHKDILTRLAFRPKSSRMVMSGANSTLGPPAPISSCTSCCTS